MPRRSGSPSRAPQGRATIRTAEALALRSTVNEHRAQVDAVLARYGARNPRLFGSVARGDARATSDLDVLVDLDPSGRNPLMRLAGLTEELTNLLGVRVDVVAEPFLRQSVSAAALADVIPL